MKKMVRKESIQLAIEDLEERIAPGVPVLTTGLINDAAPDNTVVGPAAAAGGAATAVTAIVGAGVEIDNLDIAFVC
jgi:hypothetical protein